MRILHCLRAPVGGLFRHVLDLAAGQAERGHDVGILIDSTSSNALTEVRISQMGARMTLGIQRVAMSRQPGLGDVCAIRQIFQLVQPLKLDVLHGHGAKGGAYARIVGKLLKHRNQDVRVYYTPHGGTLNFDPGSLQGRFFQSLERRLAGMTNGLIFESAHAERMFERQIGALNVARKVIHNGLGVADFRDVALDGNASDLLFIGELRMLKGVDVLLRAIASLPASLAPTLTIVGDGPDTAMFKTLCHELGMDERVRFMGTMPFRDALALGRVAVVPSRAESLPYIVLELAASGRPMIATSVGGIPEIVAGTDTQLIPADDVEALAGAIAGALQNRTISAQKAAHLKEAVASKFNIMRMTDDVLAFYGLTAS